MTTLVPEEVSAIEQRRRRHILRVVARVVAEEGFSGATMRRIAERAGVSTGMLTYYYKNKRDLLTDMLAATYGSFVRELNRKVGSEAGPERIEACFDVMLHGSMSGIFPITFWLAYFAEAMRDEELRLHSVQGIQQLRGVFRKAIAAGIRSGEVRTDADPELTSDLLMLIWQGMRVEVGLYGMSEDRAAEVVAHSMRLLRAT